MLITTGIVKPAKGIIAGHNPRAEEFDRGPMES
jgi:hypothetical protein